MTLLGTFAKHSVLLSDNSRLSASLTGNSTVRTHLGQSERSFCSNTDHYQ